MSYYHANLGRKSWSETSSDCYAFRREMGPLEEELGIYDPYIMLESPSYTDVHPAPMFIEGGDPFDLGSGCGTIDGLPASCSELQMRLEARTLEAYYPGRRKRDPNQPDNDPNPPRSVPISLPIGNLGLGVYVILMPTNLNILDSRFASVGSVSFSVPQNPLPGFDKGKLEDVNKAIKEGSKLLKNKDCQKALAAAGINVSEVNKIFGGLKARPDSDANTAGYNIFYAEKSTDPQIQQFLQSEKGKAAGGFIYGQDILLRHAFFGGRGGARINAEISRALALIHEVVHLTGKTDADFGGSSKLNDKIIHACYNKLLGHNDLSIVGN